MTLTVPRHSHRTRGLALQFVVPLVFLLGMLLLYPYLECFEFDKDEGINVMKASLLAEGHPLYQAIWSDQPPLFTYALAGAFRIFGFDVDVARYLVLILSCMLLWGSWNLLRVVGGNTHAFAASLLIVLLPYYMRLSLSVMVGLPALAFAVVSLSALTTWYENRASVWLIMSALALGLSVFTKIFTGFLAPIFLLGIVVSEFAGTHKEVRTWQERLWPAACWTLVFASIACVLLVFCVGLANVPQLLETHLAARKVPEFESISINSELREIGVYLLLGLLGILFMLRNKRWLVLYPLAWAGTAYLLLLNHAPVWYHQQLLVTLPVAMLSAYAVGEVLTYVSILWRSNHLLSAFVLIAFIAAIGTASAILGQGSSMLDLAHIPTFHARSDVKVSSPEYALVAKMAEYAPETQCVVTDRPMYAFRAGVSTPANLAAISRKRMMTGALTEKEVFDTIREKRPEQVLLTRFKWPSVKGYLQAHYRIIYSRSGKTLYLRSDLE